MVNKTEHELYETWNGMKGRCSSRGHSGYHNYGGRGITVCQRWLNDFWNFVEDMGDRPRGCTLDRINNDGNYEPGNCRWATRAEQASNRRGNRVLTHNGQALSVKDVAGKYNLTVDTIHKRLSRGWAIEQVISTPTNGRRSKAW